MSLVIRQTFRWIASDQLSGGWSRSRKSTVSGSLTFAYAHDARLPSSVGFAVRQGLEDASILLAPPAYCQEPIKGDPLTVTPSVPGVTEGFAADTQPATSPAASSTGRSSPKHLPNLSDITPLAGQRLAPSVVAPSQTLDADERAAGRRLATTGRATSVTAFRP